MRVLEVDRRRRTFTDDTSLAERIGRQARAARETDLALAKSLLEMQETRGYIAQGCATLEDFGRRLGYAPHELRRLLKLAQAMQADAFVEERIRAKALTVSAAVEIAPVLAEPSLFDEKREWIERAQCESYSKLRRQSRRRMAEIRCGEAVETIDVRVPDSVVERFERARVLASRKAARHLSRDETFEAVVDFYVDKNDPLLVKDGKRRLGPTAEFPDERYIPISVKREIRRRAGDTCEFPGCTRRAFLEFCHRRPHRGHRFGRGSGREAGDLFLGCGDHHLFHDAEMIFVVGSMEDPLWFQIDAWGGVLVFTERRHDGRPPEGARESRIVEAIRKRQRRSESRRQGDRADPDDGESAAGTD